MIRLGIQSGFYPIQVLEALNAKIGQLVRCQNYRPPRPAGASSKIVTKKAESASADAFKNKFTNVG